MAFLQYMCLWTFSSFIILIFVVYFRQLITTEIQGTSIYFILFRLSVIIKIILTTPDKCHFKQHFCNITKNCPKSQNQLFLLYDKITVILFELFSCLSWRKVEKIYWYINIYCCLSKYSLNKILIHLHYIWTHPVGRFRQKLCPVYWRITLLDDLREVNLPKIRLIITWRLIYNYHQPIRASLKC